MAGSTDMGLPLGRRHGIASGSSVHSSASSSPSYLRRARAPPLDQQLPSPLPSSSRAPPLAHGRSSATIRLPRPPPALALPLLSTLASGLPQVPASRRRLHLLRGGAAGAAPLVPVGHRTTANGHGSTAHSAGSRDHRWRRRTAAELLSSPAGPPAPSCRGYAGAGPPLPLFCRAKKTARGERRREKGIRRGPHVIL